MFKFVLIILHLCNKIIKSRVFLLFVSFYNLKIDYKCGHKKKKLKIVKSTKKIDIIVFTVIRRRTNLGCLWCKAPLGC